MDDRVKEIAEANRLAQRAIDLGADDAVALLGGGYALVFVVHDVERGAAYIDRALALNPNLAWGLVCDGWTKAFLGEPDAAITQLSRAMRLSPLDPMSFRALGGIAFAHFIAGRYDAASFWAEKAMRERPNYLPATRDLAAAHALAGRLPKPKKRWPICVKSPPQCEFPASKIGSPFADRTTSLDWKTAYELRGYRNKFEIEWPPRARRLRSGRGVIRPSPTPVAVEARQTGTGFEAFLWRNRSRSNGWRPPACLCAILHDA